MSDASLPFEDDKSIFDDAALWRRIPPWHVVEDKNRGGKRISKAAFEDHPDGSPMSVVLGDQVLAAGRDTHSVIAGHDGFRLASVTAGLARSLGQGIMRKPLDDEPAHAEVFGNKTDSVRKHFSRTAVWVIGPDSRFEGIGREISILTTAQKRIPDAAVDRCAEELKMVSG